MLLSKTKIDNIKKYEQRTVGFYSENFVSSYKFTHYASEEYIPAQAFCLLHLVDPICHAIKLIINCCRFLVSLIDLAICYLSGCEKNIAIENTKNTLLLIIISFANIIISALAFLPRAIKTTVDVFSENPELINDQKYKEENNFFNNIIDVFASQIQGGKRKHAKAGLRDSSIFAQVCNFVSSNTNAIYNGANNCDPGF